MRRRALCSSRWTGCATHQTSCGSSHPSIIWTCGAGHCFTATKPQCARWPRLGCAGGASKGIVGSMAVNESLFPGLAHAGYQITSDHDSIHNCIAWAAGRTDAWWWPDPDGYDYWPPGIARERTLDAFLQAFATQGYAPCSDGSFETGWEKVAIYVTDEGPTHMARQLVSGAWSSKLGPDDDIEHTIEGLAGTVYGSVAQFLRRPIAQP